MQGLLRSTLVLAVVVSVVAVWLWHGGSYFHDDDYIIICSQLWYNILIYGYHVYFLITRLLIYRSRSGSLQALAIVIVAVGAAVAGGGIISVTSSRCCYQRSVTITVAVALLLFLRRLLLLLLFVSMWLVLLWFMLTGASSVVVALRFVVCLVASGWMQ